MVSFASRLARMSANRAPNASSSPSSQASSNRRWRSSSDSMATVSTGIGMVTPASERLDASR